MPRVRTIARRSFLIGSAAVLGGFAVGGYHVLKPPQNPLVGRDGRSVLNPYIMIDAQGITVITPRAEMGQGVQTTLAALVAEELNVIWEDIKISHGPPSSAYALNALAELGLPFKEFKPRTGITGVIQNLGERFPQALGLQATAGSYSMRDGFGKMRFAGAAARQMLIAAAAIEWDLRVAEITTQDGMLRSPYGQKATYSEMAEAAASIEPPDDVDLKPRSEWRYLGKSMPRKDVPAKSTGKAVYGIDIRQPEMLFATVRMCPRLGGKLLWFNDSVARSMHGIAKIIDLGTGVAVVASNTWLAFQAADTIDIEWSDAAYPADTEQVFEKIEAAFEDGKDWALRDDGDADEVIDKADPKDVVRAEYSVPYLAHAAMEPLNATARFDGDRMTLWAGNQMPVYTRYFAAKAVGLNSEDVELITPIMGGSFGRRTEVDFTNLAARIAKEMPGITVKTTWSREEDMRHDYYRPGAIARFAGVTTSDGPIAVEGKIAAQPLLRHLVKRYAGVPALVPDRLVVEGAYDQPYAIDNYKIRGHLADLDIPVGICRSVGNSYNSFFHECFLDELASSKGLDPVEMRLSMLSVDKASRKVLEKVSELSNWSGSTSVGIGRGVAFTHSFGTPVAEVVEVRQSPEGIRIMDVYTAVDVGIALDPRNIEAQVMSSIMFGLTSAVMGEITFADSEVEQMNFPDYDGLRMHNAPDVHVAILESGDGIGGIGEPATPPSIPALVNALFDLTGKRARSLPLNQHFEFV